MTTNVCLLSLTRYGHRQAYIDFFEAVLRTEGHMSVATASPIKALWHKGPLAILMIEEFPFWTHALILLRSLMGRRTIGLMFRSREVAFGTSLRMRVKAALLRVSRANRLGRVWTIIPHDIVGGRISALSAGWIDDPQFWDKDFLCPPVLPLTPLSDHVLAKANGRKVLLVAGGLSLDKGIDLVANLVEAPIFVRDYFAVVAGQFSADPAIADRIAKADCLFEQRHITDEELYSLYGVANFAWAAYHPGYDQASGIFGRAVQFRVAPLMRAGSLVERYAADLDTNGVVIAWDDPPSRMTDAITSYIGVPMTDAKLAARKALNLTVLKSGLFGTPT